MPFPNGSLPCFSRQPERLHRFLEAALEASRGDPEFVDGQRVRVVQQVDAALAWIEPGLVQGHVHQHLGGEARVDPAVAAHGAAHRRVGVQAAAAEAEVRHRVRALQQHPVVIGGDHPEAAVGAAIDQDVAGQRGDAAGRVEAELHRQLGRVAAVVAEEHVLAREAQAHVAAADQRQLGGDHLVRERIALAAEAAAKMRLDHAHAVLVDAQHLGQRQVHVMRHLGGAVDGEVAAAVDLHLHRMRFGEGVGDRRVAEALLDHDRRRRERRLRIAEALLDLLVQVVRALQLRVQRVVGGLECVAGVEHRRRRRVLDRDQRQCLRRDLRSLGRDRGHRFADVAHPLARQRRFVLADRQYPERALEVGAGEHRAHAGQGQCAPGVDAQDARTGMRRTQDRGVQRVGHAQVVGVAGAAGDLVAGVELRLRLADDAVRLHPASPPAATARKALRMAL